MLRYCKNCGLLLPHDAAACPQCGAPAPQQAAMPQPTAPRYDAAPAPDDKPPVPALSLTSTAVAMVLFAIPIVGFVLALVWALGGTHDPARKRLAQAQLIRTLVVAVAVVLFLLTAALVFNAVVRSMQVAYAPYYW